MSGGIADRVTNSGEQAHEPLEILAAVLIGLAAMAIAWSAYQNELWSGRQDEGYTESVREANNAVDLLQAADTVRAFDQSVFVQILSSGVCSDGARQDAIACDEITAVLSDDGAVAVDRWLAGEGPSPFGSTYLEALYVEGEAARRASDGFFEEAGTANENGDNFELASTMLTAVMFLAGVSLVVRSRGLRWILLAGGSLLLVTAATYAAMLPWA